MAAVIGQHVPHLGYHLGIFESRISSKNAAYLLENNRKHAFRLKWENVKKKIGKKENRTNSRFSIQT